MKRAAAKCQKAPSGSALIDEYVGTDEMFQNAGKG
jgi:hypothetical protein